MKGEWGCNLPPSQATVHRGEIYDDENMEKGKKRQGGRPPEPPVQNAHHEDQLKTQFEDQFRQRKRLKLEQRRIRWRSEPTTSSEQEDSDRNASNSLDTSVIPVIPDLVWRNERKVSLKDPDAVERMTDLKRGSRNTQVGKHREF